MTMGGLGSTPAVQRAASAAVLDRRARRTAERNGRWAELVAALALMAKGYWILDRRHRGPFGEIDLVAIRGRRLAFVEVKLRRSLDEAQRATSGRQAMRMSDAAERWLWRHPCYRGCNVGLDAVLLAPRGLPRHIPDAFNSW